MSDFNLFTLQTSLAAFLPVLLKALAVLAVCLLCVKILLKLLDAVLTKTKLDRSLYSIIRSTAKILLLFLTILIVAPTLGIETSSLLAVLSIAGVAVSLSIQNILSNFFSGVTLLMSKPFKVGDLVTIGGQTGVIVETGITHTKIDTPDNQVILVPNSIVTSNVITNVSTEDVRRVDFKFTASYDSKPEAVLAALTEAAAHPLVLGDRETFVRLSNYGEHAIEYTVRVWTKNDDYWTVYFDILDRVLPAYEKHGVTMTYPHLNVHTDN